MDDLAHIYPTPELRNELRLLAKALYEMSPPERTECILMLRRMHPLPGETADAVEVAQSGATEPPADLPAPRILGNMDALKTRFPGVAENPEHFLQNLDAVLIMATLEATRRRERNPEGFVEGETAFGQWFRDIS